MRQKTSGVEINENRKRYQCLIKSQLDLIIRITPDGIVTFVNAAFCKSFCKSRKDLLGIQFAQLVHHDASIISSAMDALRTPPYRTTTTQRVETAKGWRWQEWEYNAILDNNNQIVEIQGIGRDITAYKNAEAALRIWSSAVNATSDQVAVIDLDGTIRFVNPAFEKATGLTAKEVIGKKLSIMRFGKYAENFCKELWDAILSKNGWPREAPNQYEDESIYVEDVNIVPVVGNVGEVESFLAIKRDTTEKRMYEQKLDRLTHHDHLTGLPNRLLLSDRLTQSLVEAHCQGTQLAVMFIDLDRFKLINDTLGHSLGDMLLKQVSERLSHALDVKDTLARMGGDEFILISQNIRNQADVERMAQRVMGSFSHGFYLRGHELFVTASIGISLYPDHGNDVETLVRNADTAMYRAKEYGGTAYQLYSDDLNVSALQRITLENDLRKAIINENIQVYYQPKIDLKTGTIIGTEALARWNHPRYGFIPPDKFIPLAEETGLIVPLTEKILMAACCQNKAWQDAGTAPTTVAVNISANHFLQGNLLDMVKRVLTKTNLAPEYLELELTEGALVENKEAATHCLNQIRAMGVRISMDDFGTGYSSLNYLRHFPVNTVKIDRSFVRDITSNPEDAAIAGAIVAMAHSLKLRVTAEGVETLQQLQFLQSLNCDEMQGYFISRPLPADELSELFQQNYSSIDSNIRKAA